MKLFWLVLLGLTCGANIAFAGDNGPAPATPYKHERFFTTFGYSFAFPFYNDLNFVIDRYNTRPNLTNKMGHIRTTHGFAISFGSTNDNYMLEFSYAQRRAATHGEDTANTYTSYRDIDLRTNFVGMGLSTKILTKNRFKLYMGGNIEFGYQSIFSRGYRNIDNVKPQLGRVGNADLLLGITIAPQLHYALDKTGRFRAVLRPYFFLQFLEAFYGDLNKTINPATYTGDNNNNLYGHPSSIGAEVKIFIAI